MADIIRLRGSPHEQTQSLLPWYANQTLEGAEAALVEQHLAECGECREALDAEMTLAVRVASAPLDVEHGWALIDDKLLTRDIGGRSPRGGRLGWLLRRRATLVWAATAQLAAAVLVVVAVTALRTAPAPSTYHALGSPPSAATGNAVILFAPDTRESEMRAALDGAHARMVDGPTATGAYVLRVSDAGRGQALARLRGSRQVLLAEPIDSEQP